MTKISMPLVRAIITIPFLSVAAHANSMAVPTLFSGPANMRTAFLQLTGSMVTGNGTGWIATNSGQVYSPGNNSISGNGAENTAPPAAPTLTPTFIAKNIVSDFGATCNGVVDDAPAFAAFNNWARQQSKPIQLTIPATRSGGGASVCQFISFVGTNWVKGIKQLTVIGYGATISDNNGTGAGFNLGGVGVCPRGLTDPDGCSARLATVAAGATSAALLDPTYSSRFAPGRWALIAGYDLQGEWHTPYGFPQNAHFFEFVQITAVNPATGQISFAAPLRNAYKSTWPNYNSNGLDQGGPATLYALDLSWDTVVEYQGLTISSPTQINSNGRSITYRDVTFTGKACGIPSQNLLWQAIDTNMSDCAMETDKLVGTIVLDRVNIRQIDVQSSSIDMLSMTNSTVSETLNGTPKKAVISSSTIGTLKPGAIYYGRSDEVSCTDCVISNFVPGGTIDHGVDSQGVNVSYTMNGGIIKVPNTVGALPWAVPGTNVMWLGTNPNQRAFQVLDVTQDATNTYVKTTLTGGFPSVPLYNGKLRIQVHPAPKFTCINCRGNADVIDLSQTGAQGKPLYSYSKRTFTGDIGWRTPGATLWGVPSSITYNVTKPYTGTQNTLTFYPFAGNLNYATITSDYSLALYGPMINAKVPGLRTVTPSRVSGLQPGDSGLPAPNTGWFAGPLEPAMSVSVSTESPSVWPVITVEITTDQGIVSP